MPEKKEECPPKGAPSYMATYGDLMTLLLTFFVLVLSFSSMRQAKFQRAIGSLQGALGVMPEKQSIVQPQMIPIPQLTNLQESEISESLVEMEDATTELDFVEAVKLETVEAGILITISDSVLFDSGRARLKDPVLPLLVAIAGLATGWPNSIIIWGHTDDDPISTNLEFRDNRELSFYRANEVLRFFALQGIDDKKMVPIPMSEYHPIGTNETDRGKAKNRRVEILIQYEHDTELPGNVRAYLEKMKLR